VSDTWRDEVIEMIDEIQQEIEFLLGVRDYGARRLLRLRRRRDFLSKSLKAGVSPSQLIDDHDMAMDLQGDAVQAREREARFPMADFEDGNGNLPSDRTVVDNDG
jgi:hypothetical protein